MPGLLHQVHDAEKEIRKNKARKYGFTRGIMVHAWIATTTLQDIYHFHTHNLKYVIQNNYFIIITNPTIDTESMHKYMHAYDIYTVSYVYVSII